MALVMTGTPEAGPAVSAPLMVAGLGTQRGGGGWTGVGLVQAVIPHEPGAPLAYSIDGVAADVFPVTRDHLDYSQPDTVHVVAPRSSPTGSWSVIGESSGSSLARISTEPGIQATGTLREVTVSNLELHIRRRGSSNRYIARPFDQSGPSHLHTYTRFEGNFIRQTVTLCRFVRQGLSTVIAPEDSCLLLYVCRTTRTDYFAETFDFVVMNGKWNPDDDQYEVSEAGDGEVYFNFCKLVGYDAGDAVEFIAPRQFANVGATETNLVSGIGGSLANFHHIGPGSYFARRVVIYRQGIVPQNVARDIVRRRDFAWAEGALGYNNGRWCGFATMPEFLRLPPALDGASSPYDALIQYGEAFEADIRNHLQVSGSFDSSPAGGWSKPIGLADERGPGEGFLDLINFEAPSPGMFTGLLLRCDAFVEREHLAMINLRDNRVATARDLALPDGRLPYTFACTGREDDYLPLHFRLVPNSEGVPPRAPVREWSSIGPGQSAPFVDVTDWQRRGNWGPIHHTHSGRSIGSMRSAYYAMNDFVAELGLKFRARTANLGWHQYDAATDGPLVRLPGFRDEGNLWHIWNNVVDSVPQGRGGWDGYHRTTTRDLCHTAGVITTLHHIGTEQERDELRGEGDPDHDYFRLLGQILDRVTTASGMITAYDRQNFSTLFGGSPLPASFLPNIAERTGVFPNRDQPDQAAAGVTEKFAATQGFHQGYACQWLTPVARMLAADVATDGLLDRVIRMPDVQNDAINALAPGQKVQWPNAHICSEGDDGVYNTPMTYAEARAGGAWWFWFNTDSSSYRFPAPNWKPWNLWAICPAYHERFGQWDGVLEMARRQLDEPEGVSDAQLLGNLWEFVRYHAYERTADHVFMVLQLVGYLQSLGVDPLPPNAP